MILKESEILNILEAQDRARRKLAANGSIGCPFYENVYTPGSYICLLCHRWMETSISSVHPCNDLRWDKGEIRKRFWRNPRRV